MIAAALTGLAIVIQDQASLRNAPRDAAAQQAVLWQGDVVEVRGERFDHLQVWDHRRERAGFVRSSQVRMLSLKEGDAPQLLAVMRFLRDTPGAEALGIAYVAAYLKAAPAQAIDAEPFDALGTMAERLARRASTRQGSASETVAAHLEVAGLYGVKFDSYEIDGAIRLCYDGEAFRRVLAYAGTGAGAPLQAQARAVLALTRHDCAEPRALPSARAQRDRVRAVLLDRFDAAAFASLPEPMKNRLRSRRAGVWAAQAFDRALEGEPAGAAAQRAIAELAGVQRAELSDDDQNDYAEAAVRVGAIRWAAEPAIAPTTRYVLRAEPGDPGQTCAVLVDPRAPAAAAALARRCTYGVIWTASARMHPGGNAYVLQVQPLPGWSELWVMRKRGPEGWTIDVLPPAPSEPGIGYTEFAGWVPGQASKMLLVREARAEGKLRRSFEVMSLETLAIEKQASTPTLLTLFSRWQDAQWRSRTVSLR